MFSHIPVIGFCFTLFALSLIETAQGTYPIHCCSISTLINGRCVCNPNYHDDGSHRCVEPCWNKCKANTVCNKYTFKCSCKSGFVGNPYVGCTQPAKFQFARSSYVVSENVGTVKLQIDRFSGGLGKVTLYWRSTSITAKLNSDYKGASGSITFDSGVKWKSIMIPIVNDQFYETDETFKVTLTSSSSGGAIGPRKETVVTIKDNDPIAQFQFARSSYVVNENVGSVKLQIDRFSGNLGKVILNWKSTSITAKLNSDYKGASGSITFDSGVKWKSIMIPIVNDQFYEKDETFKVTLTSSSSGGAVGPRKETVVTIKDNDPIAQFQFARSSYVVNENVGSVKLQIDRFSGNLGKVTLNWKSTSITAKLNSDYKGASGSITFENGEKWKSIMIPIVNDQFYEKDETFKVTLTSSSSGGAVGPRKETVVTIKDNDPIAKFQFARSSYVVNENVGTVKLQIDRFSGQLGKVTLYWRSTSITAKLNSDYKGASGSITFDSGVKWKSIMIPIVNDQFYEKDETFKVTLTSSSSGGAVGPRKETVVTIKDNDPIAKFQFARSSYVVSENVGTVKLQIDRFSGHLGKVTLYWKSTSITAKLNSDYKGASGSITFENGEKWKSIMIPIVNDKLHENDEKFKVSLTSASSGGAVGPRKETYVIIKDDDPVAKFQFARSSYLVNENVGVVKLQIDRISGSPGAVTLNWKSTELTAKLNTDFKGVSGSVIFGNGENWKSVIIPIVDDKLFERLENFRVTLTSASAGGELGTRRVTTVTIKDNDVPCGGQCKNFANSYCNLNTNRCVCKEHYRGDPYHGGCSCGGGGY